MNTTSFLSTIKNGFIKGVEHTKASGKTMYGFSKNHKGPLITFVLMISYIIVSILIYKYESWSILKEYSLWTNVVFFIGLFIFLFTFATQTNDDMLGKKIPSTKYQLLKSFKYIGLIVIGLAVLFGIIYMLSSITATSYTISLLLAIGGILGILYITFLGIKTLPIYKKIKDTGTFQIIYHILFLIPCILFDGLRNLHTDFKETPKFISYILLLEIIILTLYFIIPKISTYILTHKGTQLLNKPKYIDYELQLGTYENLKHNKGFNYHYGLSFWAFIDQNNPSNNQNSSKDATILDYGGKPKITYNVTTNELKIFMKEGIDGSKVIYKTKNIPLQKWNNFVINYVNGTLDIFLNNKLIASDASVIPYMTMDNVTSGSNEGIHGGIANVMYYSEPISRSKINMLYKYFSNKYEPTTTNKNISSSPPSPSSPLHWKKDIAINSDMKMDITVNETN